MKKTVLVALILLSLLAATPRTALAQPNTGSVYGDISGQWFTDAATKYGYPEIFSDGSWKFSPDRDITRIEFVRLLHKALGININYFVAPDVKDSFGDMENAATGAGALIDLATSGIVESGGNFTPDAPLDRELMMHWAMNALKYETDGKYPIPMVKPVPFADDSQISGDYRGEIYSAVVLRLVSGRDNNMLFPKDGATRAEAVTIVSKLMTILDSYRSTVQVSASAQLTVDGSLTMSLTIRNNTDKAVAINHASGQKYDFTLLDAAGNDLYTWSADKRFMALVNKTEIKPGEEIVFSDTLNNEACSAVQQAVSMKAYIVGTSADFTIDTNGYTVVIAK